MERMIKILIAATLLLIPAYLIRFMVFGIPTNVLEIFILTTFIFSISKRGKNFLREFLPEYKNYIFAIGLIIAGLLISTMVNENYRTGLGIIKGWFVIPLLFALVLMKEIKSKEEVDKVLKWLYLGVFGVAAASLIYYFQGNLTYDGRLKAFYLSPNHLAMYIAPAVFIGLYLIQNKILKVKDKKQIVKTKKEIFLTMLLIVSIAVILTSLYLTYSYATWSAIILILALISLIKKRVKILLILILLTGTILFNQLDISKFDNLKNYSRSSLESRIMIWESSIKILKDNPIFGIGPGNFQNKYLEYQKYFPPYLEWAVPQPHNLYLAFWLQSGIAGIIGFLVLVIVWIRNLLKTIKMNDNIGKYTIVILGVMLYILIHGLVDTPYWKNDLAAAFWIIFSLGAIIPKISQKNELSDPKN